jgi:hypothetical protein
MIYNNGDEYEGGFTDEKPNGYGVFRHASGSTYKGDWKDGV